MALHNRLLVGAAAGGSLFLAFLAPTPADRVEMQPQPGIEVGSDCPKINYASNPEYELPDGTSGYIIDNLAAFALGYTVAACEHPLAGEKVSVQRIGHAAVTTVTVNVDRQVAGSNYPDSTGGAYHVSVTGVEGKAGISATDVYDVNITESATTSGKPVKLFGFDAERDKNREWGVYTNELTKPQAGGESFNGTPMMPTWEAAAVAAYAVESVGGLYQGAPTRFAPTDLHVR